MHALASSSESGRVSQASLDDWLRTPGDHEVDSSIVCVLTRFGLRSPRHLLPSYRDYRRVVEAASDSETPGLLQSCFLVDSTTSFCSFSIWSSVSVIPQFGTNVAAHVQAGNGVFPRLIVDRERGAELWSTKWRLMSVSNNLNWSDFDLRHVLTDMNAQPIERLVAWS